MIKAFTNELNEFYAHFEVSQAASADYSLKTEEGDVIREERGLSIG